ncbi:hypothetical protein CHS0354_012462 [Potamilus streckersoni]|uniref:Amine oxidase n=1 Tax=Potamilus streckersoni TaxID=2493646 RepID=A0AAE0VLN6_9BIVA|nr:hypothetical protein CHS0354_012462 [Potamilus streckersoni]
MRVFDVGFTMNAKRGLDDDNVESPLRICNMEHREQKAKICFNFRSNLFVLVVFAVGLACGILIGIYAYHGSKNMNSYQGQSYQGTKLDDKIPATSPKINIEQCPNKNPNNYAPYESSLFAPLTTKEMKEVSEILWQRRYITTIGQTPSSLKESFIVFMYLYPPRKEDAIKYLYHNGMKPSRYAKVHIQRGAIPVPDVMEYKVGPLGSLPEATIIPLTSPGEIHFNSRIYGMVEENALNYILNREMKVLETLMRESFDGATFPDDLYINYQNGPPGMTAAERETRFIIGFRAVEDGDVLNFLPLSGTVHNPGTNVSEWYSHSYYYLNQGPYSTASDLVAAYNNNMIRKVRLPQEYRSKLRKNAFPQRDHSLPLREHADQPGARSYMPKGPRFSINGTKIKWMGWSFHISGGQLRGPALFDIRFKGNQIAYELALNDISLVYAMDSSGHNNIIYMDASYGIMGGYTPTTIFRDVDCPSYAAVLNTSYWSSLYQKAIDMKSICVFEADGHEALWRHFSGNFSGGMRNRYLVVRVPVVVGNYDYIFEFQFYLDGRLYTKGKATGYILTSFWDEHNPNVGGEKARDAFGYRVSQYQTGPIHDHTFGFKVDMDVIDSNNSFETIHWKAGNVYDALRTLSNITQVPPYFIYNETRYLKFETMQKEAGCRLDYNNQKLFVLVNENKRNRWGVKRGYRIVPLTTGAQSISEEHPAMKALSFTKYHMTVTKRKEEEMYLSSIYDINRMDSPKGHLDLMLDNESIVNEDIVNWITFGVLHVPTSEDFPMTPSMESGFLLKPFNFFDTTPTFDMPQYLEEHGTSNVEHEPAFDTCVEPNTEY